MSKQLKKQEFAYIFDLLNNVQRLLAKYVEVKENDWTWENEDRCKVVYRITNTGMTYRVFIRTRRVDHIFKFEKVTIVGKNGETKVF